MKYDPQKHHRHSIRLDGYDYSQAGAYFVTIVTHQRLCLFGEIVDGQMRLNALGRIVQWEWQRLGQRFSYVQLGPFVVMPNHVHGVIIIRGGDNVGATRPGQVVGAPPCGPAPGSLGAIIGQLKSRVTKRIRSRPGMDGILVWQRNYYEHIIRNAGDYQRVQDYVGSNPAHWSDDVENLVT